MHNIFIIYMAPGNHEQMVHYEDTIKNRVDQERILRYLNLNMQTTLRNVFGQKSVAVWGSRDSRANRPKFDRMQPGDDILIVEGETIKLLGKIAAKIINPDLSRELWKNLRGQITDSWSLIYFIANPLEINMPFMELKRLFGYQTAWNPRGFARISDDKLEEFYSKYDDLYSILQRIKQGKTYDQRPKAEDLQTSEPEALELRPEDVKGILQNGDFSDHVRMQWQLVHLGMKTGARVWIPRSDQPRIKKEFSFDDFEETFSAGIDMPARYVENIDVVWKEEFRIDAAFEIEHSTAIYSGLLRFSDLKIIAPNISYPLFLVAPLNKKSRVFDQVKRPTFKKLGLDKEVRYLSYERVDEISKFFEHSSSGLNVEVLIGKSEAVQ
jgi:hypothetical protein